MRNYHDTCKAYIWTCQQPVAGLAVRMSSITVHFIDPTLNDTIQCLFVCPFHDDFFSFILRKRMGEVTEEYILLQIAPAAPPLLAHPPTHSTIKLTPSLLVPVTITPTTTYNLVYTHNHTSSHHAYHTTMQKLYLLKLVSADRTFWTM